MSTSLIITTYNWPAALNAVLNSVAHQHCLPNEVIIADDGSTEETRRLVASRSINFPVPLHHCWQQDRGFRLSTSRNRAIRAAHHDYIILIDGDMVLDPHFVADHLSHAEPDCLLTGKRIKLGAALSHKVIQSAATPGFLSKGIQRGRKLALRSRLLANWHSKKTTSTAGIHGCNVSFWRKDALSINGFNAEFEGWGPEDKEFAQRMFNNGKHRKTVKFNAVAYHLHHKENSREHLDKNNALLAQTLTQRLIRSPKGINEINLA